MRRYAGRWCLAALGAAVTACSPPRAAEGPPTDTAPATSARPAAPSDVERAASDAVGFLRGAVPFERLRLADSVTLYIAPDGGGARRVLPRDALRQRANWAVEAGSRRVSFVPAGDLTQLTLRSGRHFACHEQPLASTFPRLAGMPHVGTRLEPETPQGCLQTWNVTFVFEAAATGGRLVAAVYDQWEW
jgi:hypothetical protein